MADQDTVKQFIWYQVQLVRIVDGHTVELAIDTGFRHRYQDKFRLLGIDTPERGDQGFAEANTALGKFLKEPFYCITTKPGKYGRYLCTLYHVESGESVNDLMVSHGYAVAYDGGPKHEWPKLIRS